VFMAVLVIGVVACKAQNGFRAIAGGLALITGVCCKFAAVVKAREVADKHANEGLARCNAEVVVDQEKRH